MGIPYYFKKITTEHPDIIKKQGPECGSRSLYLDFNCAIHQVSRDTLANHKDVSSEDFEKYLIEDVLEYLRVIIENAIPTVKIYLAIDGVAPYAKIYQQRKRRFMSSVEKSEVVNIVKTYANGLVEEVQEEITQKTKMWDSNAITPGTEFMFKLDTALHGFATEYMDRTNGNVEFVISGHAESGEGEQKIFYDIKHDQPPMDNQHVNIIYGLDADLIMLSMLNSSGSVSGTGDKHGVYLMREPTIYNMEAGEKFMYMDIALLTSSLIKYLNTVHRWDEFGLGGSDQHSILKQYIFICFLVGNDFVKSMQFLSIKNDAIDLLCSVYHKVCVNIRSVSVNVNTTRNDTCAADRFSIVGKTNDINFQFLVQFLEKLQSFEVERLANAIEMYSKKVRNYGNTYRNTIKTLTKLGLQAQAQAQSSNGHRNKRASNVATDAISLAQEIFKLTPCSPENITTNPIFKINMSSHDWVSKYYSELFPNIANPDQNAICKDYIQSLAWCCDYYFKDTFLPNYYYKFTHPPTCKNMYEYLLVNTSNNSIVTLLNESVQTNVVKHSPSTSSDSTLVLQLLRVLPYTSLRLANHMFFKVTGEQVERLIIYTECAYMYPLKCTIDTSMHTFMWECSPLLPPIDIRKLQRFIGTHFESKTQQINGQ